MIRELALKCTLALLNPEGKSGEIALKGGRLEFSCEGLGQDQAERLGESWTVFLSLVLGVRLEVRFTGGREGDEC